MDSNAERNPQGSCSTVRSPLGAQTPEAHSWDRSLSGYLYSLQPEDCLLIRNTKDKEGACYWASQEACSQALPPQLYQLTWRPSSSIIYKCMNICAPCTASETKRMHCRWGQIQSGLLPSSKLQAQLKPQGPFAIPVSCHDINELT